MIQCCIQRCWVICCIVVASKGHRRTCVSSCLRCFPLFISACVATYVTIFLQSRPHQQQRSYDRHVKVYTMMPSYIFKLKNMHGHTVQVLFAFLWNLYIVCIDKRLPLSQSVKCSVEICMAILCLSSCFANQMIRNCLSVRTLRQTCKFCGA